MLISKVPDNEEGKAESDAVPAVASESHHEYQTANELFEFMAKNQNFNTGDVDKLTTRDLVILYKNIDLGTKLMSNANELRNRKPNQYVENVVYNDEGSEGSDVSDIYSNEDLTSLYLINKEKLDLINIPTSTENTLCHKIGDLEMHTSDLTTEYGKHFLFKDPYINEQLKSIKFMNNSSDTNTVLPASLLDYICCKRLEDNYNFYMDNIIRYVKHTIEQLKRISNGDYLTDKAKEKWREVESAAEDHCHVNTKVLATCTSIPMHVERKNGGQASTWDDIVHSAVDIRSLSKILEKRIVVEVPKLICGSYKLLSKCCADNVIISCKKDKMSTEDTTNAESRMDVVFQLQRSESGQVISKISSIMILKTTPVTYDPLGQDLKLLPLPYIEQSNDVHSPETQPKIVELEPINLDESSTETTANSDCRVKIIQNHIDESLVDVIDCGRSENENSIYLISSDSSDALKDILDKKVRLAQRENHIDIFPDDLRFTIQKLTMQSALAEESGEDLSHSTKKKSPTRVRIKSPYENQSLVMEEKKRKKLLEIRERRERKKMALAENCKVTKHRYGKGAVTPQSASSVTKLSISNKSFYNSIYGQSNMDPGKQAKGRNRRGGKRNILDIDIFGESHETLLSTPERDSKKYTNRSYYLDDAVTEMMYMNMKKNETEAKEVCSTSTSVISSDFRNNLNLLSQLIGPSETDLNIIDNAVSPKHKNKISNATRVDEITDKSPPKLLLDTHSKLNIVPSHSPSVEDRDNSEPKKVNSSVECRKSIDKIYNLMKKMENAQNIHSHNDSKSQSSKSKYNLSIAKSDVADNKTSTYQTSDSGTSLKHRLTSSNPSSFSFGKNNTERLTINHQSETPPAVVPKVIISSKSSPKTDPDKTKKERKRFMPSPKVKITENPLKAISQLLHEFENVHKVRHKSNTEQKSIKKMEVVSSDGKTGSRQSSLKRRSRFDQHNDIQPDRSVRIIIPREKKPIRPNKEIEVPKIAYQQIPVDEKDKIQKKKISDLLDEAKEARGEAVRGPSKLNSRLNSLAQPKRTYVQAHSEEYQTKYGKTLMADRLQRLAASQTQSTVERSTASANSRNKIKRGSEAMSTVSMKQSPPTVPPLERAFRARHSSSSSPDTKERQNQGVSPCKQIIVPETPQTLKKKMVAVESYVKNHYGRNTSTAVGDEPQSVRKARAPLLPNDVDLGSSTSSPIVEGSTELGNRLHHIINTIINTNTQGLGVLTECHETNSKNIEKADDYSIVKTISKCEQGSSDSDYAIDVLDDNNVVTSVAKMDKASEILKEPINIIETDVTEYSLQPLKSVTELEKLQKALCQHISVGAFQKRLRIKKLTLTPKQSVQPILVLQSGDAASLVVHTPLSSNFKETEENVSDLTSLPVLSKSHINWSFTNIPMQISTVGYAFPEYKSRSLVKLFKNVSKKTDKLADRETGRGTQCVEGVQTQHHIDLTAQVDVPNTLETVGTSNTKEEINKVKTEDTKLFSNFQENETVKEASNKEHNEASRAPPAVNKNDSDPPKDKQDNVDYTTSLDILVGLLNEIQNISTCQTQITNSDKSQNETQQNKELETILNKAAALETSIKSCARDEMSFTSLERLRQLESNTSLYSFYLSDCEVFEQDSKSSFNLSSEIMKIDTNKLISSKRLYVDKEVEVDVLDKKLVNKFTDVPSEIFLLGMSQNTNMTNSLIEVISEPSNQTVAENHSVYSDASSLSNETLINIPQIIVTRESLTLYEVNSKPVGKPNEIKLHDKKIEHFEIEMNKKRGKVKANRAKFRLKTEFDPIMKMKRDILVTVYSLLVFTVFAALSFPEILYRV